MYVYIYIYIRTCSVPCRAVLRSMTLCGPFHDIMLYYVVPYHILSYHNLTTKFKSFSVEEAPAKVQHNQARAHPHVFLTQH